jgi:hypothetical protein
MAVLFIAGGLLMDFVLSSLADSLRGKCRIVVVPRTGRPVCIGAIDAASADSMLADIAERAQH